MTDIPANERICPFCVNFETCDSHWYHENDYDAYAIKCKKGHFYKTEPNPNELQFSILRARICIDYDQSCIV